MPQNRHPPKGRVLFHVLAICLLLLLCLFLHLILDISLYFLTF